MNTITIAVSGGHVVCDYAGPANAPGPALILLHGWTLDRRMWGPQLAAFARDRFVMAPDRRGFGASSAPPDLAREPNDVATILDRFSKRDAVIVGMSQAGRVALTFAATHPQRVAGLVLLGAPAQGVTPGPGEDETIPLIEYANLARSGRLDEMKRRWRAHPLMHAANDEAARLADLILADYGGRDLGSASYLRDLDPQDFASIKTPALVVAGALDTPWRKRAADALADTLPNATRVEIAGGGHLCNLEQPQAFNSALRQFLARAAPL